MAIEFGTIVLEQRLALPNKIDILKCADKQGAGIVVRSFCLCCPNSQRMFKTLTIFCNFLSPCYYQPYGFMIFVILHAIWCFGCSGVVGIFLTFYRRKVKREESIRKLDFQDRLDILLEKRLSSVAGLRYAMLKGNPI